MKRIVTMFALALVLAVALLLAVIADGKCALVFRLDGRDDDDRADRGKWGCAAGDAGGGRAGEEGGERAMIGGLEGLILFVPLIYLLFYIIAWRYTWKRFP